MEYNKSMRKIKVGINGLGRIGRAFFRVAKKHPEIEVVAVNDLAEKANMEYLLTHDSVYGPSSRFGASKSDCSLEEIKYLSEKEPSKLPWKELGVDVVVEATGFFASAEKARAHLDAGAKRVVITAPITDGETVLIGINEDKLKTCEISSNASCTTNAASPIIAILDEAVGVEKAILNTVHAYTATQALVDSPAHK
jgi:glyceraldehyde 3-phosphate dehydrogenase